MHLHCEITKPCPIKYGMSKYTFDPAVWLTIKEFVGIYGVKMDYSTIFELHESDILEALRQSNVMRSTFIYQFNSRYITWTPLMLKNVARGYKNRQLYEELGMKLDIYNQNQSINKRAKQ